MRDLARNLVRDLAHNLAEAAKLALCVESALVLAILVHNHSHSQSHLRLQ